MAQAKEHTPLIYLIAGEASGDVIASRLMEALRQKTDGKVKFAGVGGETMYRAGFKSLFDNSLLAVMGLAEVIPKVPTILSLIRKTVKDIKKKKPDIVVTVDSWSFSDRIHKKLRKAGIPHIHYVAPQVWAWRPKRAASLVGKIDCLLTLFPFESKYFEKYGVKTKCVGHPVIEGYFAHGDGTEFRKKHGIKKNAPLLCVLPGSRHNETKYLLPIFSKVIAKLKQRIPDLHIVVPTVQAVSGEVALVSQTWNVPTVFVLGDSERADAFAAADVALAASGTVSLELAMAGVPHVIAYKLHPFTAFLAHKLIKVKYVNLINIIADSMVIPELLQEMCTAGALAYEVEMLFTDENRSLRQRMRAQEALAKIGYGKKEKPSFVAATEILSLIAERSGTVADKDL